MGNDTHVLQGCVMMIMTVANDHFIDSCHLLRSKLCKLINNNVRRRVGHLMCRRERKGVGGSLPVNACRKMQTESVPVSMLKSMEVLVSGASLQEAPVYPLVQSHVPSELQEPLSPQSTPSHGSGATSHAAPV